MLCFLVLFACKVLIYSIVMFLFIRYRILIKKYLNNIHGIVLCYIFVCMKLRRRLSKVHFAKIMGIYFPSRQSNSRVMRKDYFTDDVLKQLGLSEEEYKSIKVFSHDQSLKIVKIFDLDAEDLKRVGLMTY